MDTQQQITQTGKEFTGTENGEILVKEAHNYLKQYNISDKLVLEKIKEKGSDRRLVLMSGNWPDNGLVWSSIGTDNTCKALDAWFNTKGMHITSTTVLKSKAFNVFSKPSCDMRKLFALSEVERNSAICSSISKIVAQQTGLNQEVIYERIKDVTDIPQTLNTLAEEARSEAISKKLSDRIKTLTYSDSVDFPRFEGKYDDAEKVGINE